MPAAVSAMSSSFSLPRYISASSSLKKDENGGATAGARGGAGGAGTLTTHNDWGAEVPAASGGGAGAGDPLDFDLLAEYLLDDGTGPGGMDISFDFK